MALMRPDPAFSIAGHGDAGAGGTPRASQLLLESIQRSEIRCALNREPKRPSPNPSPSFSTNGCKSICRNNLGPT